MDFKIRRFFIKVAKYAISVLIIVSFFILILNIFIKVMSPASTIMLNIGHNDETSRLLDKKSIKYSSANKGNKKLNLHKWSKPIRLKDLFKPSCNLSDSKKFNLPFVPVRKYGTMWQNNHVKPAHDSPNGVFSETYNKSGRYVPNFAKGMRRKLGPNASNFSVLFATNKIALVEIDGKKYYVRPGINIKGNYILGVSLYGLRYSYAGKVKTKHLSIN